ncbi:MAG: alpha-D-ribose 1-methylphosphonate 5-triphosphate diphosphatase [Devosiaceae bacterium]|nr:alpha-D-ribose 1-methylphosphonate 5-triphosphate diphosphatase [Devosiaceae bacterium MH13]
MLDRPASLDGVHTPHAAPGGSAIFTNATFVLPTALESAPLAVEDGVISAVGFDASSAAAATIDCEGDYLIPGVVDLHTDHVETHVHPRSTVQWKFLPALMAHDAVVISGGTTTVFDSLCVGATMKRPERREILLPLIDALDAGQKAGAFRAEHLLHLRCEISDPDTPKLTEDALKHPLARIISVMDHTPGDRQSPDIERWFNHMIHETEISQAEGRERMDELLERSARLGAKVRATVIELAKQAGVPIMSHDDRSVAHVDQASDEGVSISEFPTTVVAAKRARSLGLKNIAGAPNFLRGGSQSGNVAVRTLLEEGLVDALASDYVPRSPLDCAFAIASDEGVDMDLPAAIGLVTDAPAQMAGLTDRGRLEVGRRADLVRVALVDGQPIVRAVWRAGNQVF